jgi:hypothetical protein
VVAAGQTIYALDFPDAKTDVEVSFLNTTSTSYTAAVTGGTSADCAVVFVAPTSGRVLLLYTTTLDNSSGGFTYAAPEVRTGSTIGSGSTVLAANDDYAIKNEGSLQVRFGGHYLLTGLTPGQEYNARLMHRVSANTGTLDERIITAVPTP